MCCLQCNLFDYVAFRWVYSITDAICIVLFTHFNDTVGNVMSMVEILAGCRWQGQHIVAAKQWYRWRRWRCLTAIHALLKLIDTRIYVIIVLMMMLMMTVRCSAAVVGLCGPALRYSWSFCMRRVGRVVVRKMW